MASCFLLKSLLSRVGTDGQNGRAASKVGDDVEEDDVGDDASDVAGDVVERGGEVFINTRSRKRDAISLATR